jgi:hypothetical protein
MINSTVETAPPLHQQEPNWGCGFLSETPLAKMRSQKYRKQPHAKVQAAGMDASKAS